ncbi:MAG: class I SAM-dependent methyltransferase [Bryobacterales bacterium]|nr:class I SAM-dependent methyltransferase [Bryobacterales bacterium]
MEDIFTRSPVEWIDGVIPSFCTAAESIYDRRPATVDIYTGIAYGHLLFGETAAEPLYERLAQMAIRAGEAGRILDVGCGAGRITYDCAPVLSDTDFVCVDLSKEMCRRAWRILVSGGELALEGWEHRGRAGVVFRGARHLDNVRVARADVLDLPLAARSFDVVTAALVLCRVEDPMRALGEMVRVLRPGGRLILATPFAFNDAELWRRFWPGSELRRVLRGYGLEIEEWEDGVRYEEMIDGNGNGHLYRVTVCGCRLGD